LAVAVSACVHRFPRGLRVSTLEERREFYEREFDIIGLSRWIGDRSRHMKFAMILGRHTGIVAKSHLGEKDDVAIIDDWNSAGDVREFALEYLPEGLYYDRNRYLDVRECAHCGERAASCKRCYNYNGQQLAFDLDPENVDCPYHGHIGDKLERGSGLSFCMYEFKAVRGQAANLLAELHESFEQVRVVFSGRGFHLVVYDEKGYLLSTRQRKSMAKKFAARYDIDEWVTEGGSRLMRLPYSLNAIVSRKCMEIERERVLKEFDPRNTGQVIPKFARSS